MIALRSMAAGALLLIPLWACMPADGQEGTWRTVSWSRMQPVEDSLPFSADVRYAAGRLALRSASLPVLYSADLTWDADASDAPQHSYDSLSRALVVQLDRGSVRWPNTEGAGDGQLRLALSRSQPLSLRVELGGTASDLDMTGLRLADAHVMSSLSDVWLHFDEPNLRGSDELRIENRFGRVRARGLGNANASSISASSDLGALELDFSGRWTRDMTLELAATLSRVSLRVPDDIGVEMIVNGRWGNMPDDWTTDGDRMVSPNWDQARYHLSVRGRTTMARVTVR